MNGKRNRLRWAALAALTIGTLPASCVEAVYRETLFGALDGFNVFATDLVVALLTAVVPGVSVE